MSFVADKWIDSQHTRLIDTLKNWGNINSGSFHVAGVTRMADTIRAYTETNLGVQASVIELSAHNKMGDDGNVHGHPVGPLLKLSKRPEANFRILLCGHMDTVFPQHSGFQKCHQIDNATLGGPGVADMKGGLLVMLTALEAFEQTPQAEQLGWDILFNPDEEIGSLCSAPYLESAAKTANMGMIFEPSMPDGWLAGSRRGSGNYSLVVHGKAAHAGREIHAGRNAITALAKAMQELDELNNLNDNITLNLARISGGGPTNIVPDLAICQLNIRVSTTEDQRFAEQHVQKVADKCAQLEGFSVELHGGFTRPPKPATVQQEKLFELVKHCGRELDIDLGFRSTGGCCDGNNLLAAGLPNVDTLGVRGGEIHSANEYMIMDSLVQRAQLSHLILHKIATDSGRWLS